MSDDATLKIGGDSEALVAAVKKGGDAFQSFVEKTSGYAEQLSKKLREVSGTDVIAQASQYAKAVDAIGGSSKLTTAEKEKLNATLSQALDKYKALGIEAPAVMQRLAKETEPLPQRLSLVEGAVARLGPAIIAAFTIGAISKLTGDFIGLTGSLVDLEGKTGINVVGLHKMKLALEESGVGLETAAKASNEFQKRLAEGDKSATGAVERLHVDLEALKQLRPEDQFLTMADAVGKLTAQGERVSTVNDLFGRQGVELLPALNGRLKETADAYERMGLVLDEDVIRAGDELGDQWTVLKSSGGALLSAVLSPIVPVLTTVASGVSSVVSAGAPLLKWVLDTAMPFKHLDDGLQHFAETLEVVGLRAMELPGIHGEAANALDKSRKAAESRMALGLQMTLEEEERVTRELTAAVEASIEKNKQAAAAAEAYRLKIVGLSEALSGRGARKELDALREAWARLSEQERQEPRNIEALLGMYDQLRARLRPDQLPKDLENLWVKAQAGFENLKKIDLDDWINFDTADPTAPIIAGFEKLKTLKLEDWIDFDKTFTGKPIEHWVTKMTDAARLLPAQIAQAFASGGGWEGALLASASTLGSAGLSAIFGKPGESGLLKNMSGILGDVLGAAVPVIGGLIGPALSKLGRLFGIGINDEVRKANGEIDRVKAKLLETHGPMDVLEAKARAVGLSFQENWGHQGQEGLKAFNELAAEFERRWTAINQELADTRTELTGAIAEARQLGYEFDETGKLTGVSVEAMRSTAQAFGIDLQALGPQFEAAQLRERMGEVINAFTLMDVGGTQTGTILTGLKDEIQAIVVQSIRLGVDIPANMRPWIQNLIETGQLTDENGEKLTDLSRLKFGEPVATEFEKISTRIGELIDAIAELVAKITSEITPAIDNATRNRNIHVGFTYDPPPDFSGLPGLARGKLVTHPTIAQFAEGGEPELAGPKSFMTDALVGALQRVSQMESAVVGARLGAQAGLAALGGMSNVINIGSINIPISAESVDRASIRDLVHAVKDGLVEELSGLIPVGVST
jgi:hypothetical protein